MEKGRFNKKRDCKIFIQVTLLVFLFLLNTSSLYSQVKPLRTVSVKVALASELRGSYEWKAVELLRRCSRLFISRFGICITIKVIEYWNPEKKQHSMEETFCGFRKKVSPGNCDIVLGIVSQNNSEKMSHGISNYFSGYAVVKYLNSKKAMELVLLHELCHIFGAVDLHEKNSIMDIKCQFLIFDEFTSKVILINRNRIFNRGNSPLPRSKLDELIFLFKRRIALNLGESDVHRYLAFLYLERHDFTKAARECREVIRLAPDRKEIHDILGSIYRRQGEFNRAIEEYLKAIENLPNMSEIHYNLGLAYLKIGSIDLAISEFKHSIKLNPHDGKAYAHLAYLCLKEQKIEHALKYCRIALEYCPENTDVLCTSAAALILKYNSHKSKTSKKTESGMNSEHHGDDGHDSKTLKLNDLLAEAKSQCLKAIEINSSLPDAYNILGIVFTYQGNINDAETFYLKTLRLRPDFIQAHHNLGVLYFNSNMLEKASFHLKKIIEINHKSGLGFQILSKLFERPNKYYVIMSSFE